MLGEIWNAGTSLVGKGRNLLSGNGWKGDATAADYEKMMRKRDGSWATEAAQAALDTENRRFTSNAFMDAANRSMAMDEQNRQIAQQGAQQAQSLAQMYPEIWAAKRKARYQTGALSALGGV